MSLLLCKGFVILKLLLPLFLLSSLYSKSTTDNYAYQFQKLEKDRQALINKYKTRIKTAKNDNMQTRVQVLSRTLVCLVNSRSKREIAKCRIDERKRIMKIIQG